MANCLLSWINHVDRAGALFSADSQSATLPASHLADPVVGKVWRSSGQTAASLTIDFGAVVTLDVLALFGCKLDGSDTIRHRLSMDDPESGDLLDTGAQASDIAEGYGAHLHWLPETVSARYWRVDIDAPSRNAEGFFDIGRAWAGSAFQPLRNYSYQASESWIDPSVITRAPESGVEQVDKRPAYRQAAFALDHLTPEEARQLKEMDRVAGISGQVLFVPDPASATLAEEAILGRLSRSTPIKHPSFSIHAKTFEIRQSL